ncbi:alpha/beta hydrolase [Paraburkholderia sp. ZP32-5]|uniref:alpha/beta hydrolase n=1 Tax=Paraburkholderia sp. ZP32-5 TaxID=2883245 RepID=UPI001F19110A|nr:alpha/beta hydrolase [Paraburkholderia sp. ZP32-5]
MKESSSELPDADASRRRLMLAGLGCALTPLAACVADKQPVAAGTAGGPIVWSGMTQAELDKAYNQTAYAPNESQLIARYRERSDDALKRLGQPQRASYGATPIEGMNIFRTRAKNAPVHVFIHGGAWRVTDARDYAFLAEMFVGAGVNFVLLDFAWVQNLNGDLAAMAQQVQTGIAWVARNAGSFGANGREIYLSGHSSGSHLLAVALTQDWQAKYGVDPRVFKHALLLSGIYDLQPVRLSSRGKYVHLTDATEAQLSPARHIGSLVCPLTIGYASLDTPEFQRQSRDFAAAVNAAGKPTPVVQASLYNHYEELETLGNPYGIFGRTALMEIATRKG